MMFGSNDGGDAGDGRISVNSSNTDTSLDTTAAVQGVEDIFFEETQSGRTIPYRRNVG